MRLRKENKEKEENIANKETSSQKRRGCMIKGNKKLLGRSQIKRSDTTKTYSRTMLCSTGKGQPDR